MERLRKELGIDPKIVDEFMAKVADYKAKHKNADLDPEKMVYSIVEGIVGHPINFEEHKDMIAGVMKNIAKVKTGEINVAKLIAEYDKD